MHCRQSNLNFQASKFSSKSRICPADWAAVIASFCNVTHMFNLTASAMPPTLMVSIPNQMCSLSKLPLCVRKGLLAPSH